MYYIITNITYLLNVNFSVNSYLYIIIIKIQSADTNENNVGIILIKYDRKRINVCHDLKYKCDSVNLFCLYNSDEFNG